MQFKDCIQVHSQIQEFPIASCTCLSLSLSLCHNFWAHGPLYTRCNAHSKHHSVSIAIRSFCCCWSCPTICYLRLVAADSQYQGRKKHIQIPSIPNATFHWYFSLKVCSSQSVIIGSQEAGSLIGPRRRQGSKVIYNLQQRGSPATSFLDFLSEEKGRRWRRRICSKK